jgi:hypothetical protein
MTDHPSGADSTADLDELLDLLEQLDTENELLRVRNTELLNLLEDAMTVKVRQELRRSDPRSSPGAQLRRIVNTGALRPIARPVITRLRSLRARHRAGRT